MSNAIAIAAKPESATRTVLKWTLLLPVIALVVGYRWIKAHVTTPLTPAQERELEKAKRRRILRKLRGLEDQDDKD